MNEVSKINNTYIQIKQIKTTIKTKITEVTGKLMCYFHIGLWFKKKKKQKEGERERRTRWRETGGRELEKDTLIQNL